ncbi:hypothetical protein L7F22_014291 [Adiantum nelumboides]|nr:hypothetical protein [Adiantum nelumboides]
MTTSLRTLRGVIFDMDGTLTVPVIDFAQMYRDVLGPNHPRIVSGSPIDILHEIQEWPSEKQQTAYQVITRHEREAHERLQLMPDEEDPGTGPNLDLQGLPQGGEVESFRVDLHGLKASPTENVALITQKEAEIGVLTRVLSMNAGFNDVALMEEEVSAMKVPSELRRQASFMKGSNKFMKREGRAILVPTPPSKFALSVDTVILGGNCVTCGQELSGKHAAGVFQLPCVHKYHPFCFSVVSAIESKSVVPGCEWKIPHIARYRAFGNVYEQHEVRLVILYNINLATLLWRLNVCVVLGEPVVDKEGAPGASTSFTYAVDEVFDIDAMLTEHKNFEGERTV